MSPVLGEFLKFTLKVIMGLPWGSSVKNPPARAEDTSLIPRLGRRHNAVEQVSPCVATTDPVI